MAPVLSNEALIDFLRASGEATLQELYPTAKVESGVKVVDDGNLVTSAGATVTYDASLLLLEKLKLAGRRCAETVAANLYYSWSR